MIDLFPFGPRDPQGMAKAIWDELVGESLGPRPTDKLLTVDAYDADARCCLNPSTKLLPQNRASVTKITVGTLAERLQNVRNSNQLVPFHNLLGHCVTNPVTVRTP